MSDLISDLRSNCQTLQHELSEVRAVSRDRIGELYEGFDRKRSLVKYQSQSEVIKVNL